MMRLTGREYEVEECHMPETPPSADFSRSMVRSFTSSETRAFCMEDLTSDELTMLWAVLELMVSGGSVRSGGPGRCSASTLASSQLSDLNILEFHTLLKPLATTH